MDVASYGGFKHRPTAIDRHAVARCFDIHDRVCREPATAEKYQAGVQQIARKGRVNKHNIKWLDSVGQPALRVGIYDLDGVSVKALL